MTISRKRTAARVMLTLLACLLLANLFAPRSLAATANDVSTLKEAWYEASLTGGDEDDPSCLLPSGCAPAALPVVAGEKTLQVGASGGRDRARTFISLDLRKLPTGAIVSGGTLTLPVLTSEDAGSLRPETAQLSACPVAVPIEEARGGSPDKQPDYSCEAAAELKYDAKADPPTFTADLEPLATFLTSGGIAIVPSKAAREGGGTFQVAFPAQDHPSDAKISAVVTYDEAPSFAPPPAPAPAPPAGPGASGTTALSDTGSLSGGGSGVSQDFAAPDPQPAAPPGPQAPVAAGPQQPAVTPVAAVPVGYAYPAVWLAPLVLVAVAGALARTLTGEIVLDDVEDDSRSASLLTRLLAAVRPPVAPTA